MEDGLITNHTQTHANQQLPWHKPQLRCLDVSLDTTFEEKLGSVADGDLPDRAPGPVTD